MLLKQELRLKVRSWAEREITPYKTEYVEEAKFPSPLLNKLKELNIFEHFLLPPYGKPISHKGMGVVFAEFARSDTSFATALLLQWALTLYTIESLGSEEQKAKYIPKLKSLELIGGWGLTEDKIGSDAANIQTTVTKTAEGYRLNGNKRWIGNGNQDVVIVWAKNTDNKKIEGI
jgi:acyl-CoA oxidase